MVERESVSNDTQSERSAVGAAFNWAAENVAKPLWNSAVVDTWNAVANAERLGGLTPSASQVGKLDRLQEQHAQLGSAEWFAQGASRGIGSLVPFAGSTMAAGGLLSRSARFFNTAERTTAMLHSTTASQIGGAALFNTFRDTQPGETTAGNVVGGTAAVAAFSFVNPWMRGAWGAQLAQRAALGTVTAPASLALADFVSTGQTPSWENRDRYLEAAASGLAFNSLMPEVVRGATRGVDMANSAMGRGVRLDRFMDEHRLNGRQLREDASALPDSPRFAIDGNMIDSIRSQQPWLRVQLTNEQFPQYRRNVIHVRDREMNAFAEDPAPANYSATQRQLYGQLEQRSTMAQIIAAEANRRLSADRGVPTPGQLSFDGIRRAVADGSIVFSKRDEHGQWQEYRMPARNVGANSVDMQFDDRFAVSTQGHGVSTTKWSLKRNVTNFTEIDFDKTPQQQGIDTSKIWYGRVRDLPEFAQQRGLNVKDLGLHELNPETKVVGLAPQENMLGQTDVGIHMPAMPRAGQFSVTAVIEGSTWLARNGLTMHNTANMMHNEAKGPTTMEIRNHFTDPRDWRFMVVGQNIGQVKFHTLDTNPQRGFVTNTFGQQSPTGDGTPDAAGIRKPL